MDVPFKLDDMLHHREKHLEAPASPVIGMLLVLLAILMFFVIAPNAHAESVTELRHAQSAAQSAYDDAVEDRNLLESDIADIDTRISQFWQTHSAEQEQARAAAVSLYKLGNTKGLAAEMVLGATSLDDAISGWDYLTTLVESCSGKLSRLNDEVTKMESEKSQLVEQRNSAEFAVAEAETALYKSKGELDAKQSEVDALLAAADNTGLARLSASMAYSRKVRYCDGYPATAAYKGAWEYVFPGDGVPCGRSCDRGVAIPVRLAGWDDDFPRVCRTQFDYLQNSSEWMDLGVWDGRTSSLEPGDVLISISGIDGASYEHSCMYVGYEIAQEMYESVIKGTDGDLGRPGLGDVFSSASYQWGSDRGRALCLCSDGEAGSHVFRCVHPQHSTTYDGYGTTSAE